ncbi:MAG: hypothetical protein WB869_09330 [Candidatus Acidiferrales bacterium]
MSLTAIRDEYAAEAAVRTLVPATSFLAVILATGWMGGAIAAHVHVRDNYLLIKAAISGLPVVSAGS